MDGPVDRLDSSFQNALSNRLPGADTTVCVMFVSHALELDVVESPNHYQPSERRGIQRIII